MRPVAGAATGSGGASAPTGVSACLFSALFEVLVAHIKLAPEVRKQIEIPFDGLDRELDAAISSGDRDKALAAIRAWRQHWLYELGRAAR